MSASPSKEHEQAELNHALRQTIQDACLNHGGQIPFSAFMTLALYEPLMGYYQRQHPIFGSEGDFITASKMPLFGKTIANQYLEVADSLENHNIMELGAGSGDLAVTLLSTLQEKESLPKQYIIVEKSPELIELQKKKLEPFTQGCKIIWTTTLPKNSFKGLILANELLDALPVHKIRVGETLQEWYVKPSKTGFEWALGPLSNSALKDAIEKYIPLENLPKPYDTEINLNQIQILDDLFNVLDEGLVVLIDYGFPAKEYYHPDRNTGTLMTHHCHRAATCPLQKPGEQDITAHVDFSHLALEAKRKGFDVLGYTTQAHYLMGLGLLEQLNNLPSPQEAQCINTLTAPHEMGELFKVIALGKAYTGALSGFSFKDFLHKL